MVLTILFGPHRCRYAAPRQVPSQRSRLRSRPRSRSACQGLL
jgi:hypothetical protein